MLWIFIFLAAFIIMTTVINVVGRKLEQESVSDGDYEDDYRTFKKAVPKIYIGFAIIVIVIALFNSIFITNEQEIGFVSFFGETSAIDGAGMHFKVPFLTQKHVYDSTTQGMAIGYDFESDESEEEDSLMITSDFNFVNIDFYLEYRISDPVVYCYGTDDPEGVLQNIAQSAIRNTVGQYDVDSVLTTGKTEIEIAVYDDIISELQHHNTGLTVLSVKIQDSEPPTAEVSAAFKNVENTKQNADSVINNANEYANTELPAAEAEADKVKQEAEAIKTERINEAKEEIANFEALFSQYQLNPDTVKARLYYEAMEEILPNMKIIVSDDAKVIVVDGDVSAAAVAGSTAESE